jgi:A/G-specific adenine glycosylase
MSISSILNEWYLQNKRELPWRNTSNPYYIWVSEIILQQTKVAQGLDYYKRFIQVFPDIDSLANSKIEEVLKVWQGLGYYTRARNIHEGARYIVKNFNGKLPSDYRDLLSIKGIGDYTASAIASIAFGLPFPVIDGNVSRVLSRLFGITDPINSRDGEKKIKEYAEKLMDKHNPGLYNQAIMEFGAIQCVPVNPECLACPLLHHCMARKQNIVSQVPVKIKKAANRVRYFYYLIANFNGHLFLRKRDKKDIWEGLYEFPLIETIKSKGIQELMALKEWGVLFNDNTIHIISESKQYVHKLSHQTIHCVFIKLKMDKPFSKLNGFVRIEQEKLHEYPISRLIDRYIEENGI